MKAERLPGWAFRRLNVEQKEAVNRLRWHAPAPAERARLKLVLGWRRTREETIVLARELMAEGRMPAAVADELGIGERYLRRLLAEHAENGSRTAEKCVANAVPERPEVAPSCERRPVTSPAAPRAPIAGFANFAELDAWLEERRAA